MFRNLGLATLVVILSAGVLMMSGCESKSQTGALIGAGAGAGIGQAAGGDTESTLIGAGIGGAAGYLLGKHQEDKQEDEDERDQTYRNIQSDTVTVWVTNSNGSKTPVTLEKENNGYVGPKGEFYETMPSEADLRKVYGF
ncbi:Surface antigen [Anaerohalosphaera lusitana]|uniref:Surface antigen n=1 Tax=Anaerohalosphaera lusitana TaxID=1936003 RepID=A0A1U9NJ43_9BACT|nr:glycine zipper domain-containing protein [Anaerohalosphaera lusitana]AQT67754.1 Surface antigen [Anaerohalosphaera lusitana]